MANPGPHPQSEKRTWQTQKQNLSPEWIHHSVGLPKHSETMLLNLTVKLKYNSNKLNHYELGPFWSKKQQKTVFSQCDTYWMFSISHFEIVAAGLVT